MKPKRRNRLHMLLSDDESNALVAICDEHGCTTSDAVRMLIHKEVASWGRPEGDERWTHGRWQDPRWPQEWPKQVRRRNASERFYDAVAKRRGPDAAGGPPERHDEHPPQGHDEDPPERSSDRSSKRSPARPRTSPRKRSRG